ncbi:hypothetical protein GC170_13660 [bacterium]|nr:hypothetical protein [bacterium]
MNASQPDTVSSATPRTDRAIRIWIVIHGLIVLGWSFASASEGAGQTIGEPFISVLMYFLMGTFVAIPLMAAFNLILMGIAFKRSDRMLGMLWVLDALLIAAQIKFLMPAIQ